MHLFILSKWLRHLSSRGASPFIYGHSWLILAEYIHPVALLASAKEKSKGSVWKGSPVYKQMVKPWMKLKIKISKIKNHSSLSEENCRVITQRSWSVRSFGHSCFHSNTFWATKVFFFNLQWRSTICEHLDFILLYWLGKWYKVCFNCGWFKYQSNEQTVLCAISHLVQRSTL